MNDDPIVAVPADLDVEDRLVGPITFRVAGWLAVAAAGASLLAFAGRHALALAAGCTLLLAGAIGGLWRPAGRPATAWLTPLLGYWRRHANRQRLRQIDERTPDPVDCAEACDETPVTTLTARPRLVRAAVVVAGIVSAGCIALMLHTWSTAPAHDSPATPPPVTHSPTPLPPPGERPPWDTVPAPRWWPPVVDPFWFDCGC